MTPNIKKTVLFLSVPVALTVVLFMEWKCLVRNDNLFYKFPTGVACLACGLLA